MNRQSPASERGAILVYAALTMFVWFGLATFVVDFGVLWVSRHQAQNAADAAAMAGALARAYDDFDDPPAAFSPTVQSSTAIADANLVWGNVSHAAVSFPCPPEVLAPLRCVRVDVYRNGENGSENLPLWFGQIIGVPSQGVKATASARVMIANGTNCLRPWAIPDAWTEGSGAGRFTKYADFTGAPLAPPHDDYTPPDAAGPGTGFRFATSNAAHQDLGATLPLTFATDPTNQNSTFDPIVPGWVLPLEPAAGYTASVGACNGQSIEVGAQIPVSLTMPAAADFGGLYADDPLASWDAVTASIAGSCAPGCAPFSPRQVAVAVFDTEVFQYRRALGDWSACPPGHVCTPCPGGAPCASIVNIVGLFIENAAGSTGTLTSYPGLVPSTAPKLTAQSSFLKAITLVR
jgi:hypothetical protein